MLPVDLNALVRQVVDSTEPRWRSEAQARSQLIQVQVEPAPDLPLMIGNSGELRDALVNLVLNAVDAMPQGGTLTLRTFSRADTMVGIEVRDTGIGMDAQTRSRIFEPFFTTKRDKGTGLGLSMVWGVVLRHGGSIDVQSEVGRGTTFRLEFPSRHGLEQTPTASGRLHATQSLKVLCVDDDPALRDVVRELLEIIGHRVFLAPSGEDALRLFHALGPIDLVITDMGMPGMNGAELASKLKALNPRVPIILLSGWSEQMNEAGELPASVDAALAKPPRLVELRNLIDELMSKSKSQSTTSASL